jgi:hypothetical protein
LLVDFETGANKKVRWKLLDRETDGIRGSRKSFVPKRLSLDFPAPGGEQLGFGAVIKQLRLVCVIKGAHFSRPSAASMKSRRVRQTTQVASEGGLGVSH